MNKNKSLSTSRSINEDYMLFSCNDHYSSQSLLPSSSVNNILISNTSNNNLDHNHQFLQAPSPFSQFQDFALLDSFLPQNTKGHGDDNNQPITTNYDHHHPSLLPLHDPVGESHLVEPSETITTHFEDPHRSISAFQETKMDKLKKRPSTTDRHSKIRTAKGTRDRRMRLSLDVAKELFGLQDMLGFDKASKTVEWLLTQAKPEIIKIAKTLSNQFNHAGFSSGDESQSRPALGSMDTLCDLTSTRTVDDRGSNTNTTETRGYEADGRSIRGKRKMLQPRTPILKKMSKDARAEARERAKDRTKNKMMKRRSQASVVQEEAHNHHVDIVKNKNSDVNWSSFECQEEIEKLCKNDRFAVCNNFVVDKKDHILDESCDMINKLNPSFPMLNHHRSQGAVNSIEQQQHQFTDLHHFLGKPRDLMYNRCRYD